MGVTRNVNLYAHDVTPEAWTALVADVKAALDKARAASPDAKSLGGTTYDSHSDPASGTL